MRNVDGAQVKEPNVPTREWLADGRARRLPTTGVSAFPTGYLAFHSDGELGLVIVPDAAPEAKLSPKPRRLPNATRPEHVGRGPRKGPSICYWSRTRRDLLHSACLLQELKLRAGTGGKLQVAVRHFVACRSCRLSRTWRSADIDSGWVSAHSFGRVCARHVEIGGSLESAAGTRCPCTNSARSAATRPGCAR